MDGTITKRLLTLEETAQYLSIGKTQCRQLLKGGNGFGLQIGNRWYADKEKLDEWIAGRIR